MFKKLFAAIALSIFAIVGLSACQFEDASAQPNNLNGTWTYTDGDFGMVAEVKDDTILVNMKTGDNMGLYWSGTFKHDAKDGEVVVSKANREQLDASMTGSQDDAKEFTITDGRITFPFSIMGQKRTIELNR